MFSIWWTWRLQFPASPHLNVQTTQSHHPAIPEIVTITDLLELYTSSHTTGIKLLYAYDIYQNVHIKKIVSEWIYLWTPIQESVHGLKTCTATAINNIGKMLNRFQFILKMSKLMERKPHNKNSGKNCMLYSTLSTLLRLGMQMSVVLGRFEKRWPENGCVIVPDI